MGAKLRIDCGFATDKRRFIGDLASTGFARQRRICAFIAAECHRNRCSRVYGRLPHSNDKIKKRRTFFGVLASEE